LNDTLHIRCFTFDFRGGKICANYSLFKSRAVASYAKSTSIPKFEERVSCTFFGSPCRAGEFE
jgi:hypothetical protein